MSKTFAGLTIEELDAAGAAAGAEALAKAHAAGLPAAGMTRLKFTSGEEAQVLTYLHPDGRLEIADERVHFKQRSTLASEDTHYAESRSESHGTVRVARSNNTGRFVLNSSSTSSFSEASPRTKKKAS